MFHHRRLPACVLLTAALHLAFCFTPSAAERSLNLGLHASWPSTSSVAEAVSWIAHTAGSHHVLPFLTAFTSNRIALSNSSHDRITDYHENHLILQSAEQQLPYSFFTSTLTWVLHSRQYSPHVHLHYSIAEDTLLAFSDTTRSSVFAVQRNSPGTTAHLVRQPRNLFDCSDCPKITSPTFHPHPLLQPLTDEILLNPACVTSPFTIVYADVLSSQFAAWLPHLIQLSQACDQPVALRFWQPHKPIYNPSLQGFSVHVTLKSTEYKVVDDRFFETRLFTDCGYGDTMCGKKRNSNTTYMWPEPLAEKKTFTGVHVLQHIRANAEKDLEKALKHIRLFTEDGPSVTRAKEFIEPLHVDEADENELIRSVRSFRRIIGEQDAFFINGYAFDVYSLRQSPENLFGCLSAVASSTAQLRVMAAELGHPKHTALTFRKAEESVKNGIRVGLNFEQLAPTSLVWFNDILNDSRYDSWQALRVESEKDVSAFIENVAKEKDRETNERMDHTRLVKVRSNHLSLVLVVDPGDDEQFGFLSLPESVVRADLPIHVGIIMVPNGYRSSLVAAAFYYFLRLKGRKTAVQFISLIRQILQYMGGGFQQVQISEQYVEMAFQQLSMQHGGEHHSAAEVLEHDAEIGEKLKEAEQFARELNLFKNTTTKSETDAEEPRQLSLLCLLNGIVVNDVGADVVPLALAEQERISKMLSSEKLPEVRASKYPFDRWVAADSNLIIISTFSRDMKTAQRRSAYIDEGDGISAMKASSLFAERNDLAKITYFGAESKADEDGDFLVTVWLAARDHTTTSFLASKSTLLDLAKSRFASRTKSRYAVLPPGSPLSNEVLGCRPAKKCATEPTYAINGRRVPSTSISSSADLIAEIAFAFQNQNAPESFPGELRFLYHLHSLEVQSKCAPANSAMTGKDFAPFSKIVKAASESGMSSTTYKGSEVSSGTRDAHPLSLFVVLDPTRREAYVVAALVEALKRAYSNEDMFIELIIAPASSSLKKHFEQPETYHKFLLQSHPEFREKSKKRFPPRLSFDRLPQQNVLTVALEPPRAWFVSSFATNYDMDNIILETMVAGSSELHSEYELKNLIVEGSCVDETESPPQGLQLILENNNGVSVDTLVMANLGYFQLKVPTPGRWKLRLAPGPSSQIYSMKAMEMYKGGVRTVFYADGTSRVPIPVESFSGAGGILLRVARNAGMEGRSVLTSEKVEDHVDENKGLMGRVIRATLKTMYGQEKTQGDTKDPKMSKKPRYEAIHVFSVASGHLYERFLKIMISSVTKHASRRVKFWLLENYLSPSFKKVLPLFAEKHGAEIGMVTYRWPGWLRAQTEKQRIIWAYKILFLDVLFPLDVGRIIFVDSDQVIRGDLAELMDIDLQGAPYGYVPFCDSRKEVEGYRFWKTGFWKETLRGAKYRISALYVVDLNRFRETAAGDTLRYMYQTLSADPNSLSNLDQDLPNYASVASGGDGAVPIFDLPQEWLWCESWCDDESKKKAKAIDLCNNPMTKEPKLASAKRIISEWVDYDDAASKLTEELYEKLLKETSSLESKAQTASATTTMVDGKDEL